MPAQTSQNLLIASKMIDRCWKFVFLMVLWLIAMPIAMCDENPESISGLDFFESRIRPVLVEHCYECHSAAAIKVESKLLLDSRPAMRQGGSRGPVLDGTQPETSLLWRAIEYSDPELQMPPDGKLPANVLADFRHWLEIGFPDSRLENTTKPEPGVATPSSQEQIEQHWAYQIPRVAERPFVRQTAWPRDDIDAYVLANLENVGLQPSEEADRRTLLRRLYYDLIGLPPTAEQIDSFVKDSSVTAYESLVNDLLDSPHFGERMARRWMDVARYSDTKGYVFKEDRNYPHAYRYRDWLIHSFNQDLPYNEFLRFQLAADRLDPENANGHLDAMGLLTLGRRFLNNKNDIADDRIDVVTRGLMGLTVGCARCHDHKFDPIKMADYYSLHGVFADSEEPGDEPSPLRLVDRKQTSPTFIFLRGQPGNHGEKIERQFVRFLSTKDPKLLDTGSGRLDLAEAIVDPKNPLTVRVFVNRVWGWVFGTPLVDSSSDFGLRCEPPIQQAVLDRLSVDFVENRWSVKQLVKRLVLSATYRQQSNFRKEAAQQDPENRWLWRTNRRRMDFESYRDAMLLVSQQLDPKIGGPSVTIHESPFIARRTVYAQIERQNLPGVFRAFDFASPDVHVPQRSVTTVPQQGLFVLNSEMILRLTEDFGQLALAQLTSRQPESSKTQAEQDTIQWMFRKLLARGPSAQELAMAMAYIHTGIHDIPESPENAWQYGYGRLDQASGAILSFTRLPRFDERRWIGKIGFPDTQLGWVMVNADGGHPGKDSDHVSIRRWTASASGKIRIGGTLEHSAEEGDGVQAAIILNSHERMGQWRQHHGSQKTEIDTLEIHQGQTLDFVVDCVENDDHDAFVWKVNIRYLDQTSRVFRSQVDFSGMQPSLPSPWSRLAQALIATNEFCFID